jgi:hypothetical protein
MWIYRLNVNVWLHLSNRSVSLAVKLSHVIFKPKSNAWRIKCYKNINWVTHMDRFLVKLIHSGSNSRFDVGVTYLRLIILSVVDDIPINSDTLFDRLCESQIKPIQSFRGTHKGRMCICVFIGACAHMCISIYICTV